MKRPARTFVIEEDEHLENLRKIIKRDFFGTTTSQEDAEAVKMTLNGYISNYKSNENQLFSEMVHTNNQEWRQKHWWIDKQDKMLMIEQSQKFKALPYHNMLEKGPDINGINTSIVKQDAQNSFFFNRDKHFGSLQPSEYEEHKQVVYHNCKFDDALTRMRKEMGIKQEEITPMRQPWDKESNQPKESDIEATPSREHDDGHLMTWGEIESTPMRIAGPEFRIPETPERETLLNSINSKIKKQKTLPHKKSEHAMKILGSLTPGFNSSRNRVLSSLRRADSVKRDPKTEKNDLSGLLHIKK